MRIALKFSPNVRLRELCGLDEELVTETDSRNAIRLLQALAEDQETDIAAMPITDRDRLMAELHIRTFGPRIQSTVACRACTEKFDLDFSLPDMLHDVVSRPSAKARFLEGAMFELRDGTRFCLPNGNDELALSSVPTEEVESLLLKRCVEGPVDSGEEIQEILDEIAPLLSVDLNAVCPECSEQQEIHFSIQSYFLKSLLQARQHLTYEVHRIASSYGWSLAEIMSLPRSRRKQHVHLIEAEMGD